MSNELVELERYAWWEVIAERAALTPDRVMVEDDRGRRLTYAEFAVLAERVAAGFWNLGMRPGHVVSWQLPTTIESPLVQVALSRLKISQNPVIPMLRRAELSLILEQLDSQWLLIPGVWRNFDYSALADEVTANRACQVVVCDASGLGPGEWALPLGDPAVLPRYFTATADTPVRCYFYTTGTTGVPKGVIHTEHTMLMCARYQVDRVGINEHDVIPITFPYTHVGGPMVLFGHLRICSKVLFIETWDPIKTPIVVSRMGATLLGSAVPFFLAYLDAQAAHGAEPMFPNLRFGMAGGAPLPPEIDRRFAAEMPCDGIMNAWGLTECPCPASVVPDDPTWAREGSTGLPVAGVVVRITGPDGAEVPVGHEGEVLVNAPQRFLGYVDSSLDAAALTADGFLRTGDLGKVDEHGYLWITGRIKDIIIRNAENISAVEVEDVLYKHPAIASVAVIGVPDPVKGEHCCAVVVLADGIATVTLAELATHCRAAGLANQKIPEQIEFVDALPVNSMGKVVKHELRARYAP